MLLATITSQGRSLAQLISLAMEQEEMEISCPLAEMTCSQ
jgi:hypothetical protein